MRTLAPINPMEAVLPQPLPPPVTLAQQRYHYILALRMSLGAPNTMQGFETDELHAIYEPDDVKTLISGQPLLLMGGIIHVDAEAFITARLAEAMLHPDAKNHQQDTRAAAELLVHPDAARFCETHIPQIDRDDSTTGARA